MADKAKHAVRNTVATVSRKHVTIQAFFSALALLTLCVALGLMHVLVPPFPRKFFCDDQTIKYPVMSCTVPYYILAPVGVLTAWVTVAAAEWSLAKDAEEPRSHLATLMSFASCSCATSFRARYFSQVLYGVYHFCVGLAACDFLMGMTKNVLGRHRPFFYTVCQPEFPAGGCNSSLPYDISVCRPGIPKRDFWDAQRSFPSGHASFGIFCATFIVLYVYRRGVGLHSAVRLAVQFSATVGGLYAGYSRVSDYKHHWSDVLAGGILGGCVAWAAATVVPAAADKWMAARLRVDRQEHQDGEDGTCVETSVEVI